jgi:hypothetical protein
MHVHLPKALHGWREFAKEVGVIVLGVLIALAAEQFVERLHWREQVRTARASIHREMQFDLAEFADRLRVAPCMDRQIGEARQRLDALAATGSTPSQAANLITPARLILTGDYEAQQAAQNLVHFPADELSALGIWYDQVRNIQSWNAQEVSAWSGLSLLNSGGTKLGPVDVALLRRDLETATNLEFLTVLNARRQIARAAEMGVSPGSSRKDYAQRLCERTT